MNMPAAAQVVTATTEHLGGGGVEIPVVRIVVSLAACLAIAALAILFLRQRGGQIDLRTALGRVSSRRSAIDVIEVRRLSLHGDVCLIRHDDREYLLLVQAGDSRVLRERDVVSNGRPAI